jgi:ribosome biogenesis GTPase
VPPTRRHRRPLTTTSTVPPPAPAPPADGLAGLGWDAGWDATSHAAGASAPDAVPGRVARADRGRALVVTAAGPVHAALLHPDVTAGDWVLVDGDVVRAVLPRRTALVRGAGRKDARGQILAANVDVVLLVAPLTTAPNLGRIDRMLAVAWSSGARPVVVLTKADLSAAADTERDEVAESAPGAAVVLTSTVDGRGLAELRTHLAPGRTLVLVGASGAGKSSLVNALAGPEVAFVAPIRPDGKGRHTTTARELVVLPGLGVLLDTPGLRGVQVWDADEGLDRTFADVAELAERCRFRDCAHRGEPDCAVAAAVADGVLSQRRVDSYRALQRENAWLRGRYDARLRAEQRRAWRALSRAARSARQRRRPG